MAEVPVRKLVVSDSSLGEPLTLGLPWEQFAPAVKREIDRLDRDDSGTLTFSVDTFLDPDPSKGPEVSISRQSSDQFMRLLWSFGGETAKHYQQLLNIQNDVYTEMVRPLFKKAGYDDPLLWEKARQILTVLADVGHLCEMSEMAISMSDRGRERKFLEYADTYLLEAKRLASDYPQFRQRWYNRIEKNLQAVRVLDKFEMKDFRKAIRQPYLMPATGAPVTVNLLPDKTSYEIPIRIAVPKGTTLDGLKTYVLSQMRLTGVPATFRGEHGAGEISLKPVRVMKAGKITGQAGSDFSSLIRPESVSTVLFEGDRDYYTVVYSLEDPRALLQGRNIMKWDLKMTTGADVRTVPGALVIQDKKGKSVRLAFASDLHISDRDYETKKVMIASLRSRANQTGEDRWSQYADRVERFYASMNENVEQAITEWNEAYREGRIDRVVLAGDLADFINIAGTLSDQGYRGTNVRRLVHMISKIEAPILMKPGNHDVHLAPFARGDHQQGFPDDGDLSSLYMEHYDGPVLDAGDPIKSKLKSVEALLTRRCATGDYGDLECFIEAYKELIAQYPFTYPSEEGMAPYFRQMENHEADMTLVADNTYLFQWKTNEEHFNADRWKFEEIHEPVGLNLYRGTQTYVFDQHVNGKGPRPKTYYYFLQCLAEVQKRGGQMILAEHYPPFFKGKSAADQTPDAADALRGEPNWALRLAAYYFRHANGEPVISTIVSGHVHRWGEYDFKFESFGEEEKFRTDLKNVFEEALSQRTTPEEFYEKIHHLWHEYELDRHIVTRRVIDDKNGVPGPIMREFNTDSAAYGKSRGTLFVNLPAIGPQAEPGYVIMEIKPNGHKEITPRFFLRERDGTVLSGTGRQLPDMRNQHEKGIVAWKKGHGLLDGSSELSPELVPVNNEMETSGPLGARTVFDVFDPLPLICQYPKGKICLGAGIGPQWAFSGDRGQTGFVATPLQLTFPLSDHHDSLWGLNYLRMAVDYSSFIGWDARIGLGLGLVDPHIFAGFKFGQGADQYYGASLQIGASSAAFVPIIEPWFAINEDGSHKMGGIGLRWMWELLSIKP